MSVVVDDNGFSQGGRKVRWDAIRAITTYKRDLVIYDDICLEFQTDAGVWVEVSEEEPGFRCLVTEIERRFPGIPQDWFTTVMHPAFKPNERVLWQRVEKEQRRSV